MGTNPQPTAAGANAPQSAAVQAAVKEQQKVDKEYSGWQTQVRSDYPWRIHLPLHTELYYVYFDINRKTFIGLIYPKAGDDVELIKTAIIKDMREQKQIPVASFPFEWTVKAE